MARVEHTCTGCVPIDASIIDVYVTLVETNKSVTNAEAGRTEAEAARVVAETQRTATFATDHSRAVADHTIAQSDHATAGEDHTSTVAATNAANAAAAVANAKAELVQARLDTADADHTRAEGDHSTAVSDHSTASSDHSTAQSDHTTAGADHTRAETDHSTAASDHTASGTATAAATAAAALATEKAALVQDKLDRADTDHTRAESDHATAVSDHGIAGTDHTTATGDHTTASADHTLAGTDHTTAASDHATAGSDHTLAASDHTTAGADHTQALADHEVMAGYDTRLTAVEGDVTELEAKVTEIPASWLLFDKLYGRFANGNLRQGNFEAISQYRVATNDIMSYNRDIVLTPSATYKFGIHYFENGVFVLDSGWKTSATTITKGQEFKIVIAKRNEDTSSIADVDEFVSQVSITNINDEIAGIKESIVSLSDSIDGKLSEKEDEIGELDARITKIDGNVVKEWHQGNVGTNGKLGSNTIRVTTKNLINVVSPLYVKCFGDVKINIVHRYATNELNSNYITETPPSAERKDYTIQVNNSYPYVNITFDRDSNNTQEILIPEVQENTRIFFDGYFLLDKRVKNNEDAVDDLNYRVVAVNERINEGGVPVQFAQGGYTNGVPNSATSRVRYERMFFAYELPIEITIPDSVNAGVYGYNLYSTAGDYASFISWTLISPRVKTIKITEDLVGTAKGVSVVFCNQENASSEITPEMMVGTETKYLLPGIEVVNERIDAIEEQLPDGNSDYYGLPVSIPVTARKNKLNSEVVLSHTPLSYSHTKFNQSMAAYNGRFFCFNDASSNDGFCVVIDISTKSVLAFVETIPSVLVSSHINNACFTDVYYDADDTYPLLLLSRGDYPGWSDVAKEMYIFRVVETNGVFSFTHIKTIKTEQYIFGASWEYDANRKMIWGHLCKHGDWRWGSPGYRKFNNSGLFFMPFADTSYICVSTNEVAVENAEITITLQGATTQTKTINVSAGQTLSPADTVMEYAPASNGLANIKAAQSAEAFSGQYTVYACDANGQNRIPINYECVIGGFKAPVLTDTETAIIPDSEMQFAKMDSGIFQGGCCFGGKLFLPFQNYSTINGVVPSYTGHCCLVIDPESAVIESLIPTDTLENEGCAILDGVLYISSHNSNAGDSATSFRIMKYTF